MITTNIYSALYSGISYKTLQSFVIGQNTINKATQLVQELESLSKKSESTLFSSPQDTSFSEDKLDELIKNSIEEITKLRQSLGITQAAGQNKPLEELFSTIKGKVFNQTL